MAKAKTTTRKTTSAKTSTKAKSTKSPKTKAGDQEVTIDRRRSDRRSKAAADKTEKQEAIAEETKAPEAAEPKMERRAKVNRRRQIDPTTCERDYTNDEIEFMQALDAYKRSSGRMFPTCSEILEVIRGLGYSRGGNMLSEATEEELQAEEPTPAFSDEVPAIED
ncbi:hypothetical protein ACYFX5_10110 [Bremerella sp. T1]|uniref:hypothetical protein n=1 Tax=Bremerella sp. TYQ1 TaxID=3119568 RepID=UPI001CCE9220|nr:hypothetical protein [Bremerella volcania]UBM38603.1 hypothetical protein LA756_12055 [Bremerella volcania]